MVKRAFMTLMYRVQQSQSLLSPVFWAATLTGVFFSILREWLISRGVVTPSQVALALVIIFLAIFTFILLLGLFYDTVLKLWKDQTIVAVQRNPYSREKLMAKEIVLWRRAHLRVLQALNPRDPEVNRDIEFMKRWIDKSMEEDLDLKEEVEELEEWVLRGSRPGKDRRRPPIPATEERQADQGVEPRQGL